MVRNNPSSHNSSSPAALDGGTSLVPQEMQHENLVPCAPSQSSLVLKKVRRTRTIARKQPPSFWIEGASPSRSTPLLDFFWTES